MVVWKIAHYKKQKHDRESKKHACRSLRQQQREAPALELDDTLLIGEDGSHPTEGKYNDLIDGRHKKTIYVKNVQAEQSQSRQISTEMWNQ